MDVHVGRRGGATGEEIPTAWGTVVDGSTHEVPDPGKALPLVDEDRALNTGQPLGIRLQ
jgi:hypothetical protein